MQKKIKVAIAGFGRSGRDIHAVYLAGDPRFKVVAIADALPERREQAVAEHKCKVYEDFHPMIDAGGFDLLVNATPTRFHVPCSLYGFEHGVHVLSEKPSAPTLAEYDRIISASKGAGKLFFPFQNSRFRPEFMKMQEIIASGILGNIVCIRTNWSGFGRRWDWQNFQYQFGGNLYNTGPHPVDQAVVLYGEAMPKVFCRM